VKWTAYIIGTLLLLVGIVWMLQGANILPGSFMTGRPEWLVAGMVATISGIWLLVLTYTRQGTPVPPKTDLSDDQ
jgi:hypothetical protein